MTNETITSLVPAGESTRNRRFGVSGAMTLIAGAALALAGGSQLLVRLARHFIALCRTIIAYDSPSYSAQPLPWRRYIAFYGVIVLWFGFVVLEILLLSMTPAFLLVRLRRPRPSLRAILKQPGTVAGLAVAFGFVWAASWLNRLFFDRFKPEIVTAVTVGGAVAVAWAFLALSRKWEAEPSWVDDFGRRLGAAAIAIGLFALMLVPVVALGR